MAILRVADTLNSSGDYRVSQKFVLYFISLQCNTVRFDKQIIRTEVVSFINLLSYVILVLSLICVFSGQRCASACTVSRQICFVFIARIA